MRQSLLGAVPRNGTSTCTIAHWNILVRLTTLTTWQVLLMKSLYILQFANIHIKCNFVTNLLSLWIIFFPNKNLLIPHSRFSILFCLNLKAYKVMTFFLIFSGQNLKKVVITLQALRFKQNGLSQTWISSKSIMQITETIFPHSAIFIKKKRVGYGGKELVMGKFGCREKVNFCGCHLRNLHKVLIAKQLSAWDDHELDVENAVVAGYNISLLDMMNFLNEHDSLGALDNRIRFDPKERQDSKVHPEKHMLRLKALEPQFGSSFLRSRSSKQPR